MIYDQIGELTMDKMTDQVDDLTIEQIRSWHCSFFQYTVIRMSEAKRWWLELELVPTIWTMQFFSIILL